MEAAGRAPTTPGDHSEDQPALRLSHAGSDPADSVLASFLGAEPPHPRCPAPAPARSASAIPAAPSQGAAGPATAGIRLLPINVPRSSDIRVGVDPTGRICLIARLNGGGIPGVLADLDAAGQWLTTDAGILVALPIAAKIDPGRTPRRIVESNDPLAAGSLGRAGIEVVPRV